jgi:signal transduction histidine kinase
MITVLRKHWILGLMGIILAFALAVVFNTAREIGQPFGGFYANRSHSRNLWQVDAPTPPWWPALSEAGLRYDDVLLEIEGRPYDSGAYQLYAEAQKEGKNQVTLTILRDPTNLRQNVPIKIFTLSNFLELKLPDLLIGLGFWLLAAAVYRTRPEETINRIFAVACSLTASAIILTIPDLFPETGWLTKLLQLGWAFSAPFVGSAFIHLAILFPKPIRFGSLKWLNLLYVAMAFVASTYAFSMLLNWQNSAPALSGLFSRVSNAAVIGIFGLSTGFYLARLLWLAWQPNSSRRLRRQVMLLLIGLALALPYVLIVVLRALISGTQSYFWNGLDLRYLVLAVPLSFAFVILRYQTFQRTPPVLIGIFILASSALVGSIGAWIIRLTEPEWVNSLNWPPFVPLFLVALISSLFWSTQSSWWGAFSRLFQWERRSYGAVRQFGQQVVNQSDLAQLPETIAAALVKNMELERAAIWLWDEKEANYRLAGKAGEWPLAPPTQLSPAPNFVAFQSIRVQAEGESLPDWQSSLGHNEMIEVVTPLAVSGRPVGLLGAGKRWDEEIFDERDLEVIQLIAQQAGLFLLTAIDIEQLRQVPQQITTAQERERFKIAQELHDTVQQFLGRLPFFLEVSRSAARTNPAETEAILGRCLVDVETAAQTVREIRNNLAPLQLENSFNQPLRMLIEHFGSRNQLEIQVEISADVEACLSPEARHALYRIVQQALDNVAAHANASRVSIKLGQNDGRIHFGITDNGQGFSESQRIQAEQRGSFGLKSMEARITSLGGEFAIESTAAGTQVSGWLPVVMSVLNAQP